MEINNSTISENSVDLYIKGEKINDRKKRAKREMQDYFSVPEFDKIWFFRQNMLVLNLILLLMIIILKLMLNIILLLTKTLLLSVLFYLIITRAFLFAFKIYYWK